MVDLENYLRSNHQFLGNIFMPVSNICQGGTNMIYLPPKNLYLLIDGEDKSRPLEE